MFTFTKIRNPLDKSDVAYAALKGAVQGKVSAANGDLPFATVLAELRAAPPAGWAAADITEGLLKQVAQDLNLPHA